MICQVFDLNKKHCKKLIIFLQCFLAGVGIGVLEQNTKIPTECGQNASVLLESALCPYTKKDIPIGMSFLM
jgi:hypothetical protein